jgi:hypothetical protein
MGRRAALALYVLALIAVVVGLDLAFFRHDSGERLVANVIVVLVFLALGWRLFRRR